MWQVVRDAVAEWWTPAAITAALGALWRWFRPRRLISFIAAVKERETMMAQAEYWREQTDLAKEQTEIEKASGLRWKAHYDECLQTLEDDDSRIATLENRLRALRRPGGISGPPS